MRRVAIFGSACCSGWCYAYDTDDTTQAMIHKHAQAYNTTEQWQKRGCDGSVKIYDSVEAALADHNKERGKASDPDNKANDLQGLFDFYTCDGDGGLVDTAWIVHMLLTDATQAGWSPESH